jgi:hypothetical protein
MKRRLLVNFRNNNTVIYGLRNVVICAEGAETGTCWKVDCYGYRRCQALTTTRVSTAQVVHMAKETIVEHKESALY